MSEMSYRENLSNGVPRLSLKYLDDLRNSSSRLSYEMLHLHDLQNVTST